MEKFKNKYRIPSARLQGYDYRQNGAYFITICTQHREPFFGSIEQGMMQLTGIGRLAEVFWYEIPEHFPFVELGAFVVMPNHVHGILVIDRAGDDRNDRNQRNDRGDVETLHCNVSTTATATTNADNPMSRISPKSGSISAIIRSYKSIVSKKAHDIHPDFAWQPRFHDHIIRDAGSFDRISQYIVSNPLHWEADKFRI